jgi:CheY-like chemotaxis protein
MKILVVDDELVIRKGIRMILHREGHQVEAVKDYDTAMNSIDKTQFDLFIVDYLIPGRSGLDVISTVREKVPGALIILISGFATADTNLAGIHSGIFEFLPKPFDNSDLIGRIVRAQNRLSFSYEDLSPVSDNRYYLSEHSWVEKSPETDVFWAGLDRRFYRTLSEVRDIQSEVRGHQVVQGGAFLKIIAGPGWEFPVWAPLSGVVETWNDAIMGSGHTPDPDMLSAEPWIVTIRANRWDDEMTKLKISKERVQK